MEPKTTNYRGVTVVESVWHGRYGDLPQWTGLGFKLSSWEDIKERIDIELDAYGLEEATPEQEREMIKRVTTDYRKLIPDTTILPDLSRKE